MVSFDPLSKEGWGEKNEDITWKKEDIYSHYDSHSIYRWVMQPACPSASWSREFYQQERQIKAHVQEVRGLFKEACSPPDDWTPFWWWCTVIWRRVLQCCERNSTPDGFAKIVTHFDGQSFQITPAVTLISPFVNKSVSSRWFFRDESIKTMTLRS